MKPRRYKWHHRIGWGVFAMLIAAKFLWEKATWTGPLTVMWIVGCFAYVLAFDSKLPLVGKLWRAAAVGTVFGFMAFVSHGEPTHYGTPYIEEIEYGDDGFEATMGQRFQAGLSMWMEATIAACVGVFVAETVRARLLTTGPARPLS